MKELELQDIANQFERRISCFDFTKHIILVPPFQEKGVDKYFTHFEKVTENLKWPKEHWTLLDPIEQDILNLKPSCALARAMAKKAILNNENKDVELIGTIIGQSFNDKVNKTITHSLPIAQTDLSTSSQISPNHQGHDTMSMLRLIQEQQNDPNISDLFHRALSENETSHVPICYYTKNGILMRKWRPPDVPANDEWKVTH